jgi:hypothetical protein
VLLLVLCARIYFVQSVVKMNVRTLNVKVLSAKKTFSNVKNARKYNAKQKTAHRSIVVLVKD